MLLAARLELERRNRDPAEIIDLNLDNSRASEIEGLTDEYINLENLSLIHVGLQNLKGFPRLTSLKKLDLSENNISGCLDKLVEACPNLEQLNLTNNAVKDIKALCPLAGLLHLTNLDVFNCPVAMGDTFREDVFNMLPNLKYLDGFDIDNQEESDAEDDDYVEEELSEEEEACDEDEEEEDEDGEREETTGDADITYEDDDEEEEDEVEEDEIATNQSENHKLNNNNHVHLQPTAPNAGKVGMVNHHHAYLSDEEDAADAEDEEVINEDDDAALIVEPEDDLPDEIYLFGDDEDDISQISEPRGVKRRYPLTSEDEITNDSVSTND